MATPAYKAQLRRLLLVPVLGLSILAGILALAVYQLEASLRWVDHTDRVIANINDVQRLMLDQEDGIRGYLLTRNTEFLAPEKTSTRRIRGEFALLHNLTSDSAAHQKMLEQISRDYEEWQNSSFTTVESEMSAEERVNNLRLAREQMDKLREEISDFREMEESLRRTRVIQSDATLDAVYWVTAALTVMTGLGLAVWILRTTRRMNEEYERRLAEQLELHRELSNKSEWVELAQAAAHAGFWQFDPTKNRAIVTSNCAKLFGLLHAGEYSGDELLNCIHPDDRARVQREMNESLNKGDYYAEFRIPLEDGKIRCLAGKGRVIRRSDATPYLVGINLDISAQKQAEEALRRNEKLAVVGRMASSISHEINNPLESVTNLLYLIQSGVSPQEQRHFAEMAQEELSRVSHIVAHTLKFHRQATNPSRELVSSLVETAVALYQGRINSSGITLERDYRDSESVFCYPAELRQVFANLIGNAFDATRLGGRIILRTRMIGDESRGDRAVRVTVADTGSGMDAHTLRHVFEPFFTTKGDNGTGLGLWVTAAIVRKHGATLQVKSSPGVGTVFSVVVPMAASLATESDETHAPVGQRVM